MNAFNRIDIFYFNPQSITSWLNFTISPSNSDEIGIIWRFSADLYNNVTYLSVFLHTQKMAFDENLHNFDEILQKDLGE